jgi:hypothetical protein
MLDIFKQAKANNQVLHFENFQAPEITWEDAVKFIYKESKTPNKDLAENPTWNNSGQVHGNLIAIGGYLLPHTRNLSLIFKGVSELMQKINNRDDSFNCSYYNDPNLNNNIGCSCDLPWHIQALRFSITEHHVQDHNDPNDVLYWQLLGTSYWKINGDKVYKLNPGDLFYFNKEDSHEVWQDGPRSGIIIDNFHSKDPHKTYP